MDQALLDRYLQAVSFWLPRERRQDIVAELSEDLRSEIEEKEAGLGRALSSSELEEILTRWGHPMLVAERYLPPRYLIGPVLFPAYRLVLKIVGLVYPLPWLLVWISLMIFDPARRTAPAVGDGLASFWLQVIHGFAVLTVLFAAVERHKARTGAWKNWTAKQLRALRPVHDPHQITRSESLIELVSGAIFLWLWLGLLKAPSLYDLGHVVRVTVWPLVSAFYWPIMVFLAAGVIVAGLNLARPWWTRSRAAVRLTVDLLGLVLVGLLLQAGPLIEVLNPAARPGLIELERWANLSWYVTLAIIGIACLARSFQAGRRAFGKRPSANWVISFMAGD